MLQIIKRLGVLVCLLTLLTGCAVPRVSAEDRLFLDLQADFLDRYELPQQSVEETVLGGLSAIAYDPRTSRFYGLSDDRGRYGPSRFYTLNLTFSQEEPGLRGAEVEAMTTLLQADGTPFPAGRLDPEGLALSPRQTVLISSEGNVNQGIEPLLAEFDRDSGQLLTRFRLPERYLAGDGEVPRGIQNNLGFEALTLNAGPAQVADSALFRLFTATESSLQQDYDDDPGQPLNSRFLHYLLGQDQSTLIAEYCYPLDLEPMGAVINGLSELLTLDQGGHFLALERAYGLNGFQVKLYQLATGGATDTSAIGSLKGRPEGISPIRKRLLLDFDELGLETPNLEGMTLGPRLGDGSRSLILVSDNNFESDRPSEFWLLRLRGM